jgi:sigma-E factor negative regulatory protein RseA
MKQQLSAFIDGEIVPNEAPHLITAVKAGGEVKQAWSDYHLIGDVMRGDQVLNTDLTSRIMLALESEPTILVPNLQEVVNNQSLEFPELGSITNKVSMKKTNESHSSYSNRLWSIAASVAAVFFVGVMTLQQYMQEDTLAPVQIAQELPEEYLAAHQFAAPSSAAYYIQNASFTEQGR